MSWQHLPRAVPSAIICSGPRWHTFGHRLPHPEARALCSRLDSMRARRLVTRYHGPGDDLLFVLFSHAKEKGGAGWLERMCGLLLWIWLCQTQGLAQSVQRFPQNENSVIYLTSCHTRSRCCYFLKEDDIGSFVNFPMQ